MSKLYRVLGFLCIVFLVSLGVHGLRDAWGVGWLECSKTPKTIVNMMCKGKVDCAPSVTCALSVSLPKCPSDETLPFLKTTLRVARVAACNEYQSNTSCTYCPGFLYCAEYAVFSEDDIDGCSGKCPDYWYESQSPDRCL